MTPQTTTSSNKPRVRHINGTRYVIESRSHPGIGRQVDVATGECSCPAGKHGRRCYHAKWAEQYDAWRQEQARATAMTPVVPARVRQTSELRPLSSYFE